MNNNKAFTKNKNHSRMFLSGILVLFKKAVKIPDYTFRGWARGFTLIELLVVVLIIGVLSAIALPQYRKAVEKTKAAQAQAVVKTLAQAQQAYYMANGEYATSFDELAVDMSAFTGNTQFNNYCAMDTRSNNEWSFQLLSWDSDDGSNSVRRVVAGRISGPYQGAGWAIELHNHNDRMLCVIQTTQGVAYNWERAGSMDYCQHLFGAKGAVVLSGVWNAWVWP